jgi:hypothetical protein
VAAVADLEDDLRRVLNDPAHALAPWPDAVQRVRAGMRRRYGRRFLVRMCGGVALVIAAMSAVVVPSLVAADRSAPHPRPAPSLTVPGTVIAWEDLPVADAPEPSLSPRPAITACRLADLHRVPIGSEGAGGTRYYIIHMRNDGHAACTLSGKPRIRGVRSGQTRDIRATTVDAPVLVPGAIPATIEPGEYADLTIETYGGCLDGRPETTYTAVKVAIGGGDVSLGETLNTTCGVGESPWRRPPPPEPPAPGAGLTAGIPGGFTQTPERELTFVVRLTNPTAAAITLDPCPNYSMMVSLRAKIVGTHQLNCFEAGGRPRVIPPHGFLDFAMVLSLIPVGPPDATNPADVTGSSRLTWSLLGSDVIVTAPVTIR